jgi:hypothetical protein
VTDPNPELDGDSLRLLDFIICAVITASLAVIVLGVAGALAWPYLQPFWRI